MTIYFKKFAAIIALLGITGMSAAYAADSTAIKPLPPNAKPVVQPYLLAQGEAHTATYSNYQVNQLTTNLRCSPNTTPVLSTSVNSVAVYGALQAIEGVHNTVALDPKTYFISGKLSAPVNVSGAYDNGASINWQVWCQPKTTA